MSSTQVAGTDLAARAAAVIPGGVNSGQRQVPGLEDMVVTATSGSTFTDAGGRVFTDYHAAFGPPLLGHNDPDVEAAGLGPVRAIRAFGGYAGWAGGQLEEELAEEAWVDCDAASEDVFTDDHEGLWSRVLERKGGSWRIIARMPEDPSRN